MRSEVALGVLCKYRDPGECPETLMRNSLMVDQPRKSTSGRRQRARATREAQQARKPRRLRVGNPEE